MKKLIFKKFILDTLAFFITSILIIGTIVWTLQAVNYFDFVTTDGHSLKVYFSYTILNFPKIIHRILPFIFFISLFYIIISYENRNELSIYWLNGISRVNFANKIIFMSFMLMFLQIWFGSYLSPLSQLKARSFLKSSNVDFFSSLLREKKFVNSVKGLTIFINKKNENGTFSDIFIEDSSKPEKRMIYAKTGIL
ncbi:LptF/LptG family permease, partial [Candidatus Pelagibacter sp.]|nr:LptF/LptG family permease [Candidatus Pelagibacter sp.]